jgi:CBS domain-containing protein
MRSLATAASPESSPSGGVLRAVALGAVALGADPDRCSVDEVMTAEVFTVPPDMPLQEAAREMARLARIEHGGLD